MMMFMLIFNTMLVVIGTLHIFVVGFDPYDISVIAISALVFSVGGLVAGSSLIGFIGNPQASATATVVTTFSATFWGTFGSSLGVIYSISEEYSGVYWLFAMYFLIAGYMFVVGVMQMVTGGWRGFK